MKKRIITVFLILVFTVASGVTAQNRDSLPHVSRISVESKDNLIRLSWVDSPDARGPVYIFRSARPFSGSIPANIRPVEVRYGQQSFTDDTDDMGNIYYFIAASEPSGRRYDVIIPRTNSTSVLLGSMPQEDAAPSGNVSAESEPVQGISNLRAVRDGERVIVTYNSTFPRRRAVLYRRTQPILRSSDLLNAVVAQSGIASPYVDVPIPGFMWYYAIVYEDEISSGSIRIRPGINATTSAVSMSSDASEEQPLRPIPLPIMTLHNTMPSGFFLAERSEWIPLSDASVFILRNTEMPQKEPLELKRPRVFAVDLEAPTGGEESALFQIVMEHFVKYEWEDACAALRHYLSLPRSRNVEARARFYLGQTLYYIGEDYREALMEFLFFRAFYQAEANTWIDAVLTAMVY